MEKNDPKKIDDVVQAYLKALGVEHKIKEIKAVKVWKEFVGKTINNATKDVFIKDRKLFVFLRSSIIRSELLMIRTELKDKINEKIGEEIILEIIVK